MTEPQGERTRVVHLAARLPVGGMETVVANLARGLPASRYRSSIWCLEEADRLGEELRESGVDLVEWHRRKRRDFGLFVRLARGLRTTSADLLHCHDELSWFYGAIAAWFAGIPTIVTMHGRRPDISPRHLTEQRWLGRRTARIVAVSEFLRSQLVAELRPSPGQVETILNGIPVGAHEPEDASGVARVRVALGVSTGAVLVGSVGELSAVKNFELALEAVARARHDVPELELLLVGDGALRASLEAKAGALGIADMVHFAGIRRDVPALLPAIDVYVCSSRYEGISLSLLEAMASARPIVATSVGGNPELMQDEDSGLLVPSGDVEACAHALVRMARDASLRRRLGGRAQAAVRARFSIDAMLEQYERLYREVLGGSMRTARAS